jgi:hypothetical protein
MLYTSLALHSSRINAVSIYGMVSRLSVVNDSNLCPAV